MEVQDFINIALVAIVIIQGIRISNNSKKIKELEKGLKDD